MKKIVAWSLAVLLSLAACTGTGSPTPSPQASQPAASSVPAEVGETAADVPGYGRPLRLVTLGDGYTEGFGTSAPRRDSWPSQLVDAMRRGGLDVLWLNLAEQSHTSDIVVEEQLGQVASLAPDIVTLQVGVNDIISGDVSFYRQNLELILDVLLDILPAERIFAVTTPDHTLTEYGQSFGSASEGHAAVEAVNATLEEVAAERGVEVIDISAVNELVTSDPSLVIGDGPYGTPKQYAGWVEIIGPRIRAALPAIEP